MEEQFYEVCFVSDMHNIRYSAWLSTGYVPYICTIFVLMRYYLPNVMSLTTFARAVNEASNCISRLSTNHIWAMWLLESTVTCSWHSRLESRGDIASVVLQQIRLCMPHCINAFIDCISVMCLIHLATRRAALQPLCSVDEWRAE